MRIKSIRLCHYPSFSDSTFYFAPGLNLIYGPNEAGKTTLLSSITLALFGTSKARLDKKVQAEVVLVLPDGKEINIKNGKPAIMDMSLFLFENIFFVRTGELEFERRSQFLSHLKAKLLDASALGLAKERIKEFIGKELRQIGEKNIRSKGKLLEEKEGLEQEKVALEEQKEIYLEIRHLEEEKKRLFQTEEELKNVLAQWEEKEKLLEKVLKKRSLLERLRRCEELDTQRHRLKQLEKELAVLKEFKEEEAGQLNLLQEQVQRIGQKIEAVQQQLKEVLREIEEKKEKMAGLESLITKLKLSWEREKIKLQAYGHITIERWEILKGLLKEQDYLKKRKIQIEDKCKAYKTAYTKLKAETEDLKEEIKRRKKENKRAKNLFSLCLILGLGLGILGIYFKPILWVIPVSVLGVGFGGYKWWQGKKELNKLRMLEAQKQTEYEQKNLILAEEEKELAQIAQQLETCAQRLRQMYQEAGVRDEEAYTQALKEKEELNKGLERLRQQWQQKEEGLRVIKQTLEVLKEKKEHLQTEKERLTQMLEEKKAEISRILQRVGVEAISIYQAKWQEKKELMAQINALRTSLEESEIKDIGSEISALKKELLLLEDVPERLPEETEIKTKVKALRQDLKTVSDKLNQLEGELRQLKKRISMPESALLNRLYLVEQRLKEIEQEKEEWLGVYQVFLDIEKKAEEMLKDVFKKASSWFAYITNNCWQGLKLKNGNIQAIKEGRAYSLNQLSSGTKDQLYLAVRMAMAQAVKPKGAFLLLDDPFLTCDQGRTLRLLKVIKELARQCQIILATKETWLKAFLEQEVNVITLNG